MSRLPLGTSVVRLTIGNTTVFLPQRTAAELGSALTTAAKQQGLAARLGAATGAPR